MSYRNVEIETLMNGKLTHLIIGNAVLYFSYETLVAFHVAGQPRVVAENSWSNTSGRHINHIDGGSDEAIAARLPYDEFLKQANKLIITVEQEPDMLDLAQNSSQERNQDGQEDASNSGAGEDSAAGGLSADGGERDQLAGVESHPDGMA